MDCHKSLYKENSAGLSFQQRNQRIRNTQKETRVKQRKDLFWNNRNISECITPLKEPVRPLISVTSTLVPTSLKKNVENKENAVSSINNIAADKNSEQNEKPSMLSRIAKVALNGNTKKLSRQEEYLLRFIKWKDAKKEERNTQRNNKLRPFLIGTSTSNNSTIQKTSLSKPHFVKNVEVVSSFMPKNHTFTAPNGLTNYKTATPTPGARLRKSFYTVVPTPPKKDNKELESKRSTGMIKALLTSKVSRPNVETGIPKSAIKTPQFKSKTNPNESNAKKSTNNTRAAINDYNEITGYRLRSRTVLTQKTAMSRNSKTETSLAESIKKNPSNARSVGISSTKTSTTISKAGAVGKTQEMQNKCINGAVGKTKGMQNKGLNGSQPTHKSAKLAVTLKAKKPTSTVGTTLKHVPANFKPSVRIKKLADTSGIGNLAILNPYGKFVTSTQMKSRSLVPNASDMLTDISDKNSLFDSSQKINSVIPKRPSVKRRLEVDDKLRNKFNFVHEMETDKSFVMSPALKHETPEPIEQDTITEENVNTMLANTSEVSIKLTQNEITPDQPEKTAASTEILNTLERVCYFRQQVSNEIARLHALCDKWDLYRTDNLALLQGTDGDDMINVTIGQTKLLTNKKFAQFSGLINRCEAGAKGTGPVNDGSEGTKPITAVDIEGFWSMVGLQIENVEQRFENLERWKANDWTDPEAAKVKTVRSTRKTRNPRVPTVVAKAKPSSDLQKMLRKLHADMRMKKSEAADSNTTSTVANDVAICEDVSLLTPHSSKRHSRGSTSKSQRRSSNGRNSIIVKDRKSHSTAPTILSVQTPPIRASLGGKKSIEHKPLNDVKQKYRDSQTAPSTPVNIDSPMRMPIALKSILKTPASARSKPKNVIFNNELRRTFEFTVDHDPDDQ